MLEQIIIGGFGGQGVLLMGQLLAHAGMLEGKQVIWLPSYGPEMRGGTANCNVVISDEKIGSPMVTDADTVIVMNIQAFEKYEKNVVPGGKLFVNSSLIDAKSERTDIDIYYVPASGIANELGNTRTANMVMLGAYLEKAKTVSPETLLECLKIKFGVRKAKLIPINEKAIAAGAESVK